MADVSVGNYGFLSGLANGANSFINSYLAVRNSQHQQRMQELMAGVTPDENGQLQYTPEKQLEMKAKGAQSQGLLDSQSGTSDYSKQLATSRGYLAHAGNPNIPANAFSGLSGAQQKELEGYGKADISGYQNAQKMQGLVDIKKGQLEETRNSNANRIGEAYENDPIIKNSKIKLNAMQQSGAILENPNKPVMPNDFNAAYQDYLAGTAPGGVPTEGKAHREIPDTFDQQWLSFKARAGQFDDMRKDHVGAQLINMLQENRKSSMNELNQQVGAQATHRHNNYLQNSNPKVREENELKFKEYGGDQKAPGLIGVSTPSSNNPHPQDQAAIAWAKANPNDPRAKKILGLANGQ